MVIDTGAFTEGGASPSRIHDQDLTPLASSPKIEIRESIFRSPDILRGENAPTVWRSDDALAHRGNMNRKYRGIQPKRHAKAEIE